MESLLMGSESNFDYPQISFLRMLHRATNIEEEDTEYKRHYEMQHPHCVAPESDMHLLFKLQNPPPTPKTESSVGPTRKKRKRTRPTPAMSPAAAGEAESQRMNHIAVERNRRKLMNCHLTSLRSLMPESYVQRGDQASIIGGAIDFVKELEQLLVSLQSKKRAIEMSSPSSSEGEMSCHVAVNEFFVSPQFTGYSGSGIEEEVDVEATMVHGHVNLKVMMGRRRGQLLRAIAAMEDIGFVVMHLNITCVDSCSVLYSLNLKMEEGCRVGTADEVAAAVHQIFTYINASYS